MYHNRFKQDFPLADLYQELREALTGEAALAETVQIKDLQLNLSENTVSYGSKEFVLGERARSILCLRLGLGRLWEVLSKERLASLTDDINDHLKNSNASLTFKSRAGEVQGVVTERYEETPYEQILTMLQHLDARPIRVYQNDYNLRVQAIFGQYDVEPGDGEPVKLGVQMRTSDMGVGALNFDVFTYRLICENGCIMGKNSVGSFRSIHIKDQDQLDRDANTEITRVLVTAQKKIIQLSNGLIKCKYDQDKVVQLLGRKAFGKKVLAAVSAKIVAARPENMYQVFNILTAAGHDSNHSQSIQNLFETVAGELMEMAA